LADSKIRNEIWNWCYFWLFRAPHSALCSEAPPTSLLDKSLKGLKQPKIFAKSLLNLLGYGGVITLNLIEKLLFEVCPNFTRR
jgi:hypothetical protein